VILSRKKGGKGKSHRESTLLLQEGRTIRGTYEIRQKAGRKKYQFHTTRRVMNAYSGWKRIIGPGEGVGSCHLKYEPAGFYNDGEEVETPIRRGGKKKSLDWFRCSAGTMKEGGGKR